MFATGANRIMPPDPIPNPPVIDWPFWYQFGAPGPTWGCDVGTTPMLDTGAGLLNNSVPGVFNLLGSTSYSCKNLAGELTWDAPNRKLKVKGTIYIDGSSPRRVGAARRPASTRARARSTCPGRSC